MVEQISTPQNTNCEKYRPLLEKYDWEISIAYAIMQAENRSCDPAANNAGLNTDGTNDAGLMQINSIHVDSGLISDADRYNPDRSIKAAYMLYKQRASWDTNGWNAWATFNNGEYKKYI